MLDIIVWFIESRKITAKVIKNSLKRPKLFYFSTWRQAIRINLMKTVLVRLDYKDRAYVRLTTLG